MLRSDLVSFLVGTITMATLAACSANRGPVQIGDHFSLSEIAADSTLDAHDKAEELSLAAERLSTPQSFMYAHAAAVMALQFDPKNPRARLLEAIFAPSMEMRGIARRILPFIQRHPDTKTEYIKFLDQINKRDAAVRDFLFQGPMDIESESDAQEVVARVTLKLDNLRRTLNELKDQEVSLQINTQLFIEDAAGKPCRVLTPKRYEFDLRQCPQTKIIERKANLADFEFMKQQIAGLQVYLTVGNGYNLDGFYEIQKLHNSLSRKVMYENLMLNSKFGTLRTNTGYGVMPDVAKDAVLGARYALEKQNELCNAGEEYPNNRLGYIFNKGICWKKTKDLVRVLNVIESAALGNVIEIEDRDETYKVRPKAYFTSPIQDLRSVAVSWGACDTITAAKSSQIDDIFPTGDLDTVIKNNENCKQH